MEFADIGKVSLLSAEKQMIQHAIQIFVMGGRIVEMIVAHPETPDTAVVQTTYMEYPPQMIDAIRNALVERQKQITDELAELGVSGMPEQPQPPPDLAVQQAKARKK